MLKIVTPLIIILLCHLNASAGKYTTVILDPGHGGKDRGAKWGGISEAYLNLKVAKKVEAILKVKKIPVRLTRKSDVYMSLNSRAAIANRYKDAIFISIHFNAHLKTSIRGVETFYASSKGRKIAAGIQKSITSRIKTPDRGIKKGVQFAVLNKTRCPAILVECGFISNPYERRRSSQSWYQNLLAKSIAEGIVKTR